MPNKPTYEELEHRVRILEKSYSEIKQAQEALRDSESLFRNLFECHATVQLVIDPDSGNIVNANNAAATFYGWTREQLQQMRIQDFNTLSLEEIKQEMKKARTNQRIQFEFHHRLADGSIRDVEVVSSKIEAKGKDLLHSVIHDITARKQAEKALRESEESFSQLFESAPVPMAYVTDVDGYKGTTWNEAWYQTFGYAREQAEGRSGNDIGLWVKPSDRSRFIEMAIRQNYVADFETLLRRCDGSIRNCSLFARFIDKTGHRLLMAVYLDITDRKRLEFELRQSQQHYVMAERLAKIGHWVRNVDSDTAFWSAGIYHIFGLEPTTPAPDQDTFLSMVHPDDRQFIRKGIQRVWAFRKPDRVQYRIIRQDGSLRVVDSLIEPFISQDGQTVNLHGTLQDVTEWSAAQDQLRKKEHELQEQLVDIERKRTALSVLLEHRENEKMAFADRLLSNAKLLILPYLEELDKYSEKKQVADIVDIIRRHLYELLSPFATRLSIPEHRLTSTEIKVADMVVHDKSSKEIAAILKISPKSVSHHRANIRKKFGLTNRKINLKTFLLSYQ